MSQSLQTENHSGVPNYLTTDTQDSQSTIHQNRGHTNNLPLNAFDTIQRSTVRIFERISSLWSKINHITTSGTRTIGLRIDKLRKAIFNPQRPIGLAAIIRAVKRWRE